MGSFVEDLIYVVSGTLRPLCLFIGVCNKVLISLLFMLLNIFLIYSLMTSFICVKHDPGTHMRYILSKPGVTKLLLI